MRTIWVVAIRSTFKEVSSRGEAKVYLGKSCHTFDFQRSLKTNSGFVPFVNFRCHTFDFQRSLKKVSAKGLTSPSFCCHTFDFQRSLKNRRNRNLQVTPLLPYVRLSKKSQVLWDDECNYSEEELPYVRLSKKSQGNYFTLISKIDQVAIRSTFKEVSRA